MSDTPSLFHYYSTLLRLPTLDERYHAYVAGRELALTLIDLYSDLVQKLPSDERKPFEEKLRRFESQLKRMPEVSVEPEKAVEMGKLLLRLHVFLRFLSKQLQVKLDESFEGEPE